MDRKLGLPSVIATGVGLIVATSCLMSLGQGAGTIGVTFIIAMLIACGINICTALSLSELNALMPDLTGGLAQYTLACMGPFATLVTMVGGYLVCNTICGSVECAMFGNSMNSVFHTSVPSSVFCVILLIVLIIVNLCGIDMFAKIQNFVAYGLIISLVLMGLMGVLGLGTGKEVSQPWVISSKPSDIFAMVGLAFFLFLGCEFVVPIAKNVRNARRNIPLGMVLSLIIVCVMEVLIVLGMHNYTEWGALASNVSPHIYYGGALLGGFGRIWMAVVSIFAVISTVNSVINSLAYICAGMAKINLLPHVFMRKNRFNAPYVGILMIGGAMIIINATGLSTTDQLAQLILIGCVFWMVAYILANINVLILRHRLPKAPRTFRVPGGVLIPFIGIAGNVFMIINISSDPAQRLLIYEVCIGIFAVLSVYALFWIHRKMNRPCFKAVELSEVMAMEGEGYFEAKKKIEAAEEAAGENKSVTFPS